MENIKLICFDLDETLITHNSWKHLNLALGVTEAEDLKMWEEYNEGSLSYEDWNQKILNIYLKKENATRTAITKILSTYTYSDGAREIITYLKNKGYEIILLSGSIDILVSIVAKDLGIKWAKANNTFLFDENQRLQAIHCDGEDTSAKARYLESFCEILNVNTSECACIGDGANDLELFKITGHGITFKGSSIEKEAWKTIENLSDLKQIF